ncbi:hypothetical protein Dac01nite_16560 [Demequina activiva]|uniref:Uncharacterized protein n=1 Tax=Demequina activiva TaxID=1582364 RepID=A0A919Q2M2_9MICO|nr:hypothetical protein Dac01nite_16560 [Demequina activiva]
MIALAPPAGAALEPNADATDPGASAAPVDPMTIEVPYLAQAQVSINAAWDLAACPAAPEGAPVQVSCEDQSGGVVVTASAFDPDAGPWPFPIEVTTESGDPRTLDYTLALALPEAPTPVAGPFESPGVAGGRTLIPLAALVAECTFCSTGVAASAQAVDPEDGPVRVRAWIAERHLVIDADADVTEAVIAVTVRDGAQTASQPAEITVPLLASHAEGGHGLHLVVPLQETVAWDAADLVADPLGAQWSIVECPPTARGSVTCTADSVTFTRGDAPGDLEDQVSVILTAPDGRSAAASITVSPTAESVRLAGAAPVAGATAPLATPAPPSTPTQDPGADVGILSALWSRVPVLP